MTAPTNGHARSQVTRRQFVRTASVGWPGRPWPTCSPPGRRRRRSRARSLRILTWSHFVPAYDTWFDKFAGEWGEKNGVKVRVDHIPHLELPARLAAEFAAGAGHDLINRRPSSPGLLQDAGGPDRHLRPARQEVRRMDPGRPPPVDVEGRITRSPTTTSASRALAQGPLRLGGLGRPRPGRTCARPRGCSGQGASDGDAVLPLQRRQPQLALGAVLLRGQGDRPLGPEHRARLQGDARGAAVRQGPVRRGHDPRGLLVGRRLRQPVPRLRRRVLGSRRDLGVPYDPGHESRPCSRRRTCPRGRRAGRQRVERRRARTSGRSGSSRRTSRPPRSSSRPPTRQRKEAMAPAAATTCRSCRSTPRSRCPGSVTTRSSTRSRSGQDHGVLRHPGPMTPAAQEVAHHLHPSRHVHAGGARGRTSTTR